MSYPSPKGASEEDGYGADVAGSPRASKLVASGRQAVSVVVTPSAVACGASRARRLTNGAFSNLRDLSCRRRVKRPYLVVVYDDDKLREQGARGYAVVTYNREPGSTKCVNILRTSRS